LVAATQKKVTQKEGEIILPRWTIEGHLGKIQSISYSYHPSEVATALKQLLDLITIATQGDTKKLRFSRDMLYGFSGVLGYYNLCDFFLNTTYGKMDTYWLPRLLDLSVSNAIELESSIGNVSSWMKYNVHNLIYDVGTAQAPCYFHPYDRLSAYQNELEIANIIIDTEKRRLLDFRKSLYLFLAALTPPVQPGQEGSGDDPVVAVKEVRKEPGKHTYVIQLSDKTRFSGQHSFIIGVPEDGEIKLSEDDTNG